MNCLIFHRNIFCFWWRIKTIMCAFFVLGSTLNGQTLLEFPWSQDMGSTDSVKVKSAKLWFRLEYRPDVPPVARRTHHSHNVTLWLFKINFRTNPMRNTTFLSGKVCFVKEVHTIFIMNNYCYWSYGVVNINKISIFFFFVSFNYKQN